MNTRSTIAERQADEQSAKWKSVLRRFFARPAVEFAIGLLVIISVILTLYEFSVEGAINRGTAPVNSVFGLQDEFHLHTVMLINDLITFVFIVELTLRFLCATSKKRYFAEFWLDIIATIPVFRVFRSARALRLLRMVRLVRLLGVISRLSSHYPYILRQGAVDFLMITGLLLLVVCFGTAAMMHVERAAVPTVATESDTTTPTDETVVEDGGEFDLEDSFWFSVYTLFAGEPIPHTPRTLTGRIVSVFLMFMGLTIFAIFAGTVSAFMIDRMRVEGRVVEWDELNEHIVICGWTPKTEIIIREYRSAQATRHTPIVVVAEFETDADVVHIKEMGKVYFVEDDFTKVSALERAGIERATTCIILSELRGGRSEQDADARTILAALTAEKVNPAVYTCAELLNRSYSSHLELGKVNDFVVSDEYGAYMIAQAAMHQGLVGVLGELLTYENGNEFHRTPIPTAWIGEQFDHKLSELKTTKNAILVAVHTADGQAHVNPQSYVFQDGDEVVAICEGPLGLE